MKRIVWFVVIILLLGAGFAYYYTQYDSRNEIKFREAEESLTATEILEIFEKDENAAMERFLGKTILVEGPIQSVDFTPEKTTVVLDAGDVMSTIVCEMNNNVTFDVDALKEGDLVKVKGECSGKLIDIILVNCVIDN